MALLGDVHAIGIIPADDVTDIIAPLRNFERSIISISCFGIAESGLSSNNGVLLAAKLWLCEGEKPCTFFCDKVNAHSNTESDVDTTNHWHMGIAVNVTECSFCYIAGKRQLGWGGR